MGALQVSLEGFIRLDHLRPIVAGPRSRKNPHMNLNDYIDALCLEIKAETDGSKLLQLIDRLDSMLAVKGMLLARMSKQVSLNASA